jgi:hypothetical protein
MDDGGATKTATAPHALHAHARRRWLVNAGAWAPPAGELERLAHAALPAADAAAVLAYRNEDDRKRTLIGRCVCAGVCAFGVGGCGALHAPAWDRRKQRQQTTLLSRTLTPPTHTYNHLNNTNTACSRARAALKRWASSGAPSKSSARAAASLLRPTRRRRRARARPTLISTCRTR